MSEIVASQERNKLLQLEVRQFIEQRLGNEPWITVYESRDDSHSPELLGGYFCALIPNSLIDSVLRNHFWDMSIGNGLPGFVAVYHDGEPNYTYHRFGDDDGIEPLVLVRMFHGMKPRYIEILEEFRLFHNLYHDRRTDTYIRIDDAGDEEVVIEMNERSVRIRTSAIKRFLACKNMSLAVYFDMTCYSSLSAEDFGEEVKTTTFAQDALTYVFYLREADFLQPRRYSSFSRLLGKKLIRGFPIERAGIWPYENAEEKYIEFIIGTDEFGGPFEYACNPDNLANYFGKNVGAPHFLTQVFFRREVLGKYYDQPEKYSVEDGYLRCGGLWGLRLDNNHSKNVIVFLGDLGSLPFSEQTYWRSFNVPPEGSISKVAFERSFKAEFAEPEQPDLVFKADFRYFQQAWHAKFGWYLFRPLSEDDLHYFGAIRVPLTEDQAEFDNLILALTRVVIETLNDEELLKALDSTVPGEKSISKLERFLKQKSYLEVGRDIGFLRKLQELRSKSSAHLKGSDYQKLMASLGMASMSKRELFEGLLQESILLLRTLSTHFSI